MPSSALPLRWIGSNHKIRAALGGGSSPWWGCLFVCCVLYFYINSYLENERFEICTYLKSTISFPPEPLIAVYLTFSCSGMALRNMINPHMSSRHILFWYVSTYGTSDAPF